MRTRAQVTRAHHDSRMMGAASSEAAGAATARDRAAAEAQNSARLIFRVGAPRAPPPRERSSGGGARGRPRSRSRGRRRSRARGRGARGASRGSADGGGSWRSTPPRAPGEVRRACAAARAGAGATAQRGASAISTPAGEADVVRSGDRDRRLRTRSTRVGGARRGLPGRRSAGPPGSTSKPPRRRRAEQEGRASCAGADAERSGSACAGVASWREIDDARAAEREREQPPLSAKQMEDRNGAVRADAHASIRRLLRRRRSLASARRALKTLNDHCE